MTKVWLLYGLCAVAVAGYLIVEDIRKLSVPLWALILWMALMGIGLLADPSQLATVLVLGFVGLALVLYQWVRKRLLIGYADMVVFASLGVFLPLLVTPVYIVLCGIFGLCSAIIWRNKRIPFMPILFLSFAVTRLFTPWLVALLKDDG
jgi:prepilin signal peptidase PulO-like enzyme (type II secretory pathway)